jgi:hypothetical protein
MYGVVGITLILAVFVVTSRGIDLKLTKERLDGHLGSPKWNYSESWASTFTLGAGVVGTLLSSSGIVPASTSLLPNAAYGALHLLFLLVAGAAPLVYVASQKADASGVPHGVVRWFLIAAAVTLWAAWGQLATLGLLIAEILVEGTLSQKTAIVWLLVVGLPAILMGVYSWKGIEWRINYQDALRKAGSSRVPQWSLL